MTVPAWMRGSLLLAVTFTAGTLTGVAYERRQAPEHVRDRADSHHHVMSHLTRELTLDSAQRTAIAAILGRHQGAVDSTWHAFQPRFHQALDSAQLEIARILRPDQAVKYRRMLDHRAAAR